MLMITLAAHSDRASSSSGIWSRLSIVGCVFAAALGSAAFGLVPHYTDTTMAALMISASILAAAAILPFLALWILSVREAAASESALQEAEYERALTRESVEALGRLLKRGHQAGG